MFAKLLFSLNFYIFTPRKNSLNFSRQECRLTALSNKRLCNILDEKKKRNFIALSLHMQIYSNVKRLKFVARHSKTKLEKLKFASFFFFASFVNDLTSTRIDDCSTQLVAWFKFKAMVEGFQRVMELIIRNDIETAKKTIKCKPKSKKICF